MEHGSAHPASLPVEALLRDCEVRRGRASGPGGQHRNKVETAVQVTHRPSGVVAHAQERRSQEENRRTAIRRLREKLAIEVRREVAGGTELAGYQPSGMWRERTREGTIACNPRHADFPAMLAEAMDVLAAAGWEPKVAGAVLGVSLSQLLKFLRVKGAAMVKLNEERAKRGLRGMK